MSVPENGYSTDEAFLDVTALGEPGDAVATRLQATIHDELALSCSLGVATNKLVAKVAIRDGAMGAPVALP